MKTNTFKSNFLFFGLALIGTSLAQGSILTFSYTIDGGAPSNSSAIPAEYGDRITATSMSMGLLDANYGQGNGFTPNVVTSYRTGNSGTNATVNNLLKYWGTSYGDLQGVGFCASGPCFNQYAEITLTADPGFQVIVNSFQSAGFGQSIQSAKVNVLVDGVLKHAFSGLIPGGGPNPSHYLYDLDDLGTVAGQTVVIRFSYDNDLTGIDNINFDQIGNTTPGVPEPGSIALMLSGLGGLVFIRRRATA